MDVLVVRDLISREGFERVKLLGAREATESREEASVDIGTFSFNAVRSGGVIGKNSMSDIGFVDILNGWVLGRLVAITVIRASGGMRLTARVSTEVNVRVEVDLIVMAAVGL